MESPASPRELLVTPYVTLHYDPTRRLIRYTRTAAPLPPMDDVEATFVAIREAIEPFDRQRVAFLVDLRVAPGRNDREFETKMEKWRVGVLGRFERVGILVKTAAGKLQVNRLGVTSGRHIPVFTDEAEALMHLTPEPRVAAKKRA